MNTLPIILTVLLLSVSALGSDSGRESEGKIQIAILLDVSGSMSGLIGQAKGQLWTLVNQLTAAERDGKKVDFELAIIAYGHGGTLDESTFTILDHLTSDIDRISESLFGLRSMGSAEPCGLVLAEAVSRLEWSPSKRDVRILFIAGNEPFDQGPVDFIDACKEAVKQNITVNTVFCGSEQMGVVMRWSEAAGIGNGQYNTIDQDSLIRHSETYWDNKIIHYNDLVNSTYLAYGSEGRSSKQRQVGQDENALDLGRAYLRDRVVFKLSPDYKNASWDLVDKFMEDSTILSSLALEELPHELHGLSDEQKVRLILKKAKQREVYFEATQIFIGRARAELAENGADGSDQEIRTLDRTMLSTLKSQLQRYGVKFE